MKIKVELEESVYQLWVELMQDSAIGVEEFVSRVLTQIAVLVATNPELIMKIRDETPKEVQEMSRRAMRPKEDEH